MNPKYFYLYLIIFLEGYVVLSTELLAIRQLIPFVGSGTETVAIIIAAVLMPLALGYYAGGNYKAKYSGNNALKIRDKLLRNILSASVFLVLGLSHIILEIFFYSLTKIGVTHRIFQVSIYSLLFLVVPVYLLGQTVPLISNFFSSKNISGLTGRILFFSTLGSFIGAILSTIVLMSIIGVNNTVIVNVFILFLVVLILVKKKLSLNIVMMLWILSFAILLNSNQMMQKLGIVENNSYSTITIKKDKNDDKTININNSESAKYSSNPERRFPYLQFVEKNFINPLVDSGNKKKILVIGAGGFTIGIDDNLNDYTFVDIDSSLKKISEDYLLPLGKLDKNKKFNAQDARAFLNSNTEKYDLIFLDAFTNIYTIPSYLLTAEFFQQIKGHISVGGVMLFNNVTSPVFKDRYTVKLDNTLKHVFPNISRQIIGDFNFWAENKENRNIIYIYFQNDNSSAIYTDDKNTFFLDH